MNISNVSSVLDMEMQTDDETFHLSDCDASSSSTSSEEELRTDQNFKKKILKHVPDSKENTKSLRKRRSKSAVYNSSTEEATMHSRSKVTEETTANVSSVSAFLDMEMQTDDETLNFSGWDPSNSSTSSEEEVRTDRNFNKKISKENTKSKTQGSKSAVSNRGIRTRSKVAEKTTTNISEEENLDPNESSDSSSSERPAKLTKRRRNSELQYQCSRCEYATADNSNFHRHMRIKHNKNKNRDKPFLCCHCNYSTAVKCNLQTHMAVHRVNESYKCEECTFSTRHPSNLKKHMLTHLEELPFKCGDCSFGTKNKTALQNHIATHYSSNLYRCDKCDYSTGEKYKLTRHKATHSKTKKFQCDQCKYSAGRDDTLKRHKKRKH